MEWYEGWNLMVMATSGRTREGCILFDSNELGDL